MKQFFNEPEIEIVTFEALDKIGVGDFPAPLADVVGGGEFDDGGSLNPGMGGGDLEM